MQKFSKKQFFVIVLLVSLLYSSVAFAAATSLNVLNVKQKQSNWCWAACCESIYKSTLKVNTISQTSVVSVVKGSSLPNDSGSCPDVQKAFTEFGYSCSINYNSLNFEQVKEKINSGTPIMALLMSQNGSEGHWVIIDAYETRTDASYIWYMDPNTGNKYMIKFTDFKNGFNYYYNNKWYSWMYTVTDFS